MTRTILALCILLTGCAIDPVRVAGAPDNHVCMAYGQFRQSSAWAANAETMRKELEARQLLTQAEWDAVNRQSLRLGMSLCAMYASMGMPSRENQHVNSAGVMTQHVYRRGSDAVYQAMNQAKERRLPWMLISKVAGTSSWLVQRQSELPVVWTEAA